MLNYFGKFMILAAVLSSLSLTSCRSVPMASVQEDTVGKSFKPNPDGARIYLYRNELFGGEIKIDVALDGQPVGKTLPNTYLLLDVPVGNHSILSESENKDVLDINAEKGKIYYVWQEVKLGMWLARNKLQLVDEATGKKGVLETKRIQKTAE